MKGETTGIELPGDAVGREIPPGAKARHHAKRADGSVSVRGNREPEVTGR